MENELLNMNPQQFEAALSELRLPAEREADIRRQYRRANSVFAPIYGLLSDIRGEDAASGRVRANVVPMTRPEGMTGLEAIMSGEAQLAVPNLLLGAPEAIAMAADAPAAAYQGGIPTQDMVGEALNTVGLLNLGSVAGTAPRGALRSGAGRSSTPAGFDEYLARVNPEGRSIPAEARPNLMIGDMYGMLPDNAKRVGSRDGVQFYEADGDFYATAYNPDVGEMDVVGYAIRSGDMTDLQVVGEMQGSGIGSELQYLYRRANPDAPSGGLTEAGERSLRRTYDRLVSEGLIPQSQPQTPAQRVAGLLASGRANEVTDEMMAAADPQEMARLYASNATGMDLPMDYQSRMARAREMGFTDDAYHSTSENFNQFVPSEFRGASFFGPTPEGAERGASASAREGVGRGTGSVIPVLVDTRNVSGIGSYRRPDWNNFYQSLENRVYSEPEIDAIMSSSVAPEYSQWHHFFDDITDYNALRQFRESNPTGPIPEGIIGFRPKQKLNYGPNLSTELSGRQFAHYSEGMSEAPISRQAIESGNTGFTMMDESGLALAMVDPTRIRSRFARFDPRLSHLSNLNAANASPVVGLLSQFGVSQDQAERLERRLNRIGLLD